MTKARVPRKRHILIEVRQNMGKGELASAIYGEALRFFGEYGCSYAKIRISEYEPERNLWVITCSRDYADKMPGFLALIEKPRIRTIRTSGTLNKLREKSTGS